MENKSRRLVFKVHGLDCAEEVASLKRALETLVDSPDRLAFDLLNGRLIVDASDQSVSVQAVVDAAARAGLRAEPWRATPPESREFRRRRGREGARLAAGALCGAGGFLWQAYEAGGVLAALGSETAGPAWGAPAGAVVLYAAAIVISMGPVAPKAWRAAIGLRPDMNLLMAVAVTGAAAIGQWFEAVTVSWLFSLSLVLESWSVGRARRAIAALMDLAPDTARVRSPDGAEREVAAEAVGVGEVFVVRPGERIPRDGRVAGGASDVNQAPITGESRPVRKEPGSEVYAGTINGDGVLEVQCTKPAGETTLARIIRMVSEAQARRAPSERWVERFARVYTPAVMGLAAALLVLPPWLFGGSWIDWFYRSLVLLVIACPCALVISTPVSVVAGLASAARAGVLIKGGVYVETPARLKAIALDKTGTLTEGQPKVIEVVPLGGHDVDQLLERAAALESHSNHPLARAIVAAARERGVSIPAAAEFSIIQGKGAVGRVRGKPYWVGSHRLLEERGQETPAVHEQLARLQQAGRTVVVVGNDRHVCGFIGLADALRPDAATTLRRLRRLGVRRLVMLTGDNQGTAEQIAREAGVDEVRAELLPEEKVQAVESLVARYGETAMVGDGVNDAPALARATLGIAMGAIGSDAAIETADVALMSDDLSKLPWLVRHSRRVVAIIRQNITASLAVKILFVLLTFAGFASLWAAIAADMGASLAVIANALRLLGAREG